MTRQLLAVGVLALAMALATAWIGWWAVPVFGAVWGVARYGAYPAATAAVSAALAWTVLLGMKALAGPVGEVSRTVGGAMALPGWVPLALSLAFPAALAGAAAGLAHGVMPLLEGGADAAPPRAEHPEKEES
jgi:hypothetical protein